MIGRVGTALGAAVIAGLLAWIGAELHLVRKHDDERVAAAAAAARAASAASEAAAAKAHAPCRGDCSSVLAPGGAAGIDAMYQAGTDQAIRDRIERGGAQPPRAEVTPPLLPASAPAPVATR